MSLSIHVPLHVIIARSFRQSHPQHARDRGTKNTCPSGCDLKTKVSDFFIDIFQDAVISLVE